MNTKTTTAATAIAQRDMSGPLDLLSITEPAIAVTIIVGITVVNKILKVCGYPSSGNSCVSANSYAIYKRFFALPSQKAENVAAILIQCQII